MNLDASVILLHCPSGFLNPGSAHQRPTVANYGLMDQLAALHWLQENIASFGGDPAQVRPVVCDILVSNFSAICNFD